MGELAPHLDGFVARATEGRAAVRYPLVHMEAVNLSPGVLGARLAVVWDEHSAPQAYHVWINRQDTGASPSAGSGAPAETVGRDEHAKPTRGADESAAWRAAPSAPPASVRCHAIIARGWRAGFGRCLLPFGHSGRHDWGDEHEHERDYGAGDDDAS